jgi:hypothetical protein
MINFAAALLALALVVAGGLAPARTAFADTDVSFNGEAAADHWTYDSYSVTAYGKDLFGAATKDMMPGQQVSFDVRLRNTTADNVRFSLLCEPSSAQELAALQAQFPSKTVSDALLDQVNITLTYAGGTIYNGNLRGTAAAPGPYSPQGAVLGFVNPGTYGTIRVTLSVGANADNRFQNTLTAVNWAFVVEQYNDVITPPVNPVIPGNPQNTSSTTVEVQGTPTAGSSNLSQAPLTTLENPETPLTEGVDVDVHKTDEHSALGLGAHWALLNLLLTIATALISLALLITYAFKRKDEEDDDEQAVEEKEEVEAEDEKVKKHLAARILGVAVAVIAIVVFILTEDMRLPMWWVDKWTILMVVIFIAQLIVAIVAKKNYKTQDNQTE